MTRRVLVTGTEGQVVGSLVEKPAGRDDIELMLIGLPELDLTATDKIAPAIEALRPDVILSVAAYTAVDAAEGDEATALAVNGEALNGATATVTPAAVENYFNVYVSTIVEVPRGCCVTVAAKNTSAEAVSFANSNLTIDRVS